MKKLSEILGKEPVDGLFGVEVECEGKNIAMINSDIWSQVDDGSLRGSFPDERSEFVMKEPLSLYDTTMALRCLVKAQEKATFNFSHRTSVHVHMNVLDLTWNEYCCLIYLYTLLEEPLMNKCGKGRTGNRFCLRVQDAEGILDIIEGFFCLGPDSLMGIREDHVRYSALNVAATKKYGSVEFRGMEGNLDLPRLNSWLSALLRLKEFAILYGNPKNLAQEDVTNLVNTVLGGDFIYPGYEMDCKLSQSLAIDLPRVFKEIQ